MYKSIIRDPGGSDLIRISPDLSSVDKVIVNGSILTVPPGTICFLAINGILSQPYSPGRYQIFTGVDPLFVKIRHLMTKGDTATSVTAYFISIQKNQILTFRTGDIPFNERKFKHTLKASAACNVVFSIDDPFKVISCIVGSCSSKFSNFELNSFIEQLILMPVRESISNTIANCDVSELNCRLEYISSAVQKNISEYFSNLGLKINRFSVTAINIPEGELDKVSKLEQQFAEGLTRLKLEQQSLLSIYGGNVGTRALCDALTGNSTRLLPTDKSATTDSVQTNNVAQLITQMSLLLQILPNLREPVTSMVDHTDLFRLSTSNDHETTRNPNFPPSIPRKNCSLPNQREGVTSMVDHTDLFRLSTSNDHETTGNPDFPPPIPRKKRSLPAKGK